MATEYGGNPTYSPSAPTGGGPATNMAAGSPYYGGTQEAPLFVGFSKPPRGMTEAKQDKLLGDSYSGDPQPQGKQPIGMTRTQLLSAFDRFSRKDYLRFRNLLIAAGMVSEESDALEVRSAYSSLISEASDMQAGGIMMSPMSLVKNLIRKNGFDPSKIGSAEDFLSATEEALPRTTTQTTVYDLTPEDARATLEQAMTTKLGRAPTPEEVEDFISAAQTRAERNPTRVTEEFMPGVAGGSGDQVSTVREGGEVATTVTNIDEGFDDVALGRMAERRAKNAPDYGSYQAVSQYFPALLQALGSTV